MFRAMKEDKRGPFFQVKEKVRFLVTEPRECISQKEAMRRAEKELDSHGENLIGSQEKMGF